jgi:hypothetical protein
VWGSAVVSVTWRLVVPDNDEWLQPPHETAWRDWRGGTFVSSVDLCLFDVQ